MIELEKMYALTTKNFYNLGIHWIFEISLVLHNVDVVFKDKDKFVFYVNNHINCNLFNQLYDPN